MGYPNSFLNLINANDVGSNGLKIDLFLREPPISLIELHESCNEQLYREMTNTLSVMKAGRNVLKKVIADIDNPNIRIKYLPAQLKFDKQIIELNTKLQKFKLEKLEVPNEQNNN